MSIVGVYRLGSTNPLFWESFVESFQNESGIDVCLLDNAEEKARFLNEPKSRLLICEHNKDTIVEETLGDAAPAISATIIAINVDTGKSLIHSPQLNHSTLIALVKNIISSHSPSAYIGDAPGAHVNGHTVDTSLLLLDTSLHAEELHRLKKPDNEGKHVRNRDDYSIVMAWLDVAFHLCTAQAIEDNEESDKSAGKPYTDWSPNLASARWAIAGEYKNAQVDELTSAFFQLSSQLFSPDTKGLGNHSALQKVFSTFQLDTLQKKIFLLILAPEIDERYAKATGVLQDNLARCYNSPALLFRFLRPFGDIDSSWHASELVNTLDQDYSLIEYLEEAGVPFGQQSLRIPHDLILYLASDGHAISNSALFDFYPVLAQGDDATGGFHAKDAEQLATWCASAGGPAANPVIMLGDAKPNIEAFISGCVKANRAVIYYDLAGSLSPHTGLHQQDLMAVARAAKLSTAVVAINIPSIASADIKTMLENAIAQLCRLGEKIALCTDDFFPSLADVPLWYLHAKTPTFVSAKIAWRDELEKRQLVLDEDELSQLASTLKLDSPRIAAALSSLHYTPETISAKAIIKATRPHRRNIATPVAILRIQPQYNWQDLVLPAAVLETLKSIPAQINQAGRVMEEWGYQRRMPAGQNGFAALFSGASGTGKTMTAQIIAAELGTEVFQVDLSKTVSKYIGETEKKLEEIFVAAEKHQAVLLFDEADALFGKRTEIKDAHDRHANVEVAYLLQRIERFSGLAILTTNLRQNLDKAFLRRLRFIVEFTMPEAQEREKIWRACFTGGLAADTEKDFKFLSRRLELSGGNIQQIAIRAAFKAAVEGSLIYTSHIVEATCEELRKLGMTQAEKNLRTLAPKETHSLTDTANYQ